MLVLGVVILALAEGSANDWLPLLMIDGHNLNHTQSTLVYAGFTAGMTLGRFLGGLGG
ncbi:putative transporter [Plautia stali symbiont]|nr:putative transporter [Plautia stali symbiont]